MSNADDLAKVRGISVCDLLSKFFLWNLYNLMMLVPLYRGYRDQGMPTYNNYWETFWETFSKHNTINKKRRLHTLQEFVRFITVNQRHKVENVWGKKH